MLPKKCTLSDEKYRADENSLHSLLHVSSGDFDGAKGGSTRLQKIFSFDCSEWHFSWLPVVVNFGHMYHYLGLGIAFVA